MPTLFTFNTVGAPMHDFVKDGVDALNDGVQEEHEQRSKRRRLAEEEGLPQQPDDEYCALQGGDDQLDVEEEERLDSYGEQAEEVPPGHEEDGMQTEEQQPAYKVTEPEEPIKTQEDDIKEIARLKVKLYKARLNFRKVLEEAGIWDFIQPEKLVGKGKPHLKDLVEQVGIIISTRSSSAVFNKTAKNGMSMVTRFANWVGIETGLTDAEWNNDTDLIELIKEWEWESDTLQRAPAWGRVLAYGANKLYENYTLYDWKKKFMAAKQQPLNQTVLQKPISPETVKEFASILNRPAPTPPQQ